MDAEPLHVFAQTRPAGAVSQQFGHLVISLNPRPEQARAGQRAAGQAAGVVHTGERPGLEKGAEPHVATRQQDERWPAGSSGP